MEYDRLERAIVDGKRLAFHRRGHEHLVIPERLMVTGGREIVFARHPTTGQSMELFVDELDGVDSL